MTMWEKNDKNLFIKKSKSAIILFKSMLTISRNYYMNVDLAGKVVDRTKFKGLNGSLLCLTASRLDIMFVDACV